MSYKSIADIFMQLLSCLKTEYRSFEVEGISKQEISCLAAPLRMEAAVISYSTESEALKCRGLFMIMICMCLVLAGHAGEQYYIVIVLKPHALVILGLSWVQQCTHVYTIIIHTLRVGL